MLTISVEHSFETGHRLPPLQGKCQNLHGHSWLAKVELTRTIDNELGIICDYGTVKKVVRGWIDEYLDHGLMLGSEDKLLPAILADGCKVFVFGSPTPGQASHYPLRKWPTVEAVAEMVGHNLYHELLPFVPGLVITKVEIRETAVNYATWTLGGN